MKVPSKFNIRTATHPMQKFSLPSKHRTTIDFMQLQPVYYRHLIPNQKIEITAHTFARLAPMVVPTFADASINLRAFYVPYKQVVPYFDEFITDSVYTPHNGGVSGIPSGMPFFTNNNFLQCFCLDTQARFCVEVQPPTGDAEFHPDIALASQMGTSTVYVYYNLTPLGRQVLKILTSLGYRFVWNTTVTTKFSAVPLLCFMHVYLDYYYSAAYQNTPIRNTLEGYLRQDKYLTGYEIGYQELSTIFTIVPICFYDSDYFTSAFDNPLGPNSGNYSDVRITDLSSDGTSSSIVSNESGNAQYPSNGTPYLKGKTSLSESDTPKNITQFALDSLKALSDYMQRNRLAGSKMLERFLARFGVKPNILADGRAIPIGSASIPLSVGDVMSTAETSDAHIGDYAGRGFIVDPDGQNKPLFTYDNDASYGMVIVCASLIPKVGYVQGIDRHILELNKLDFYNPEFDALGSQMISAGELFIPLDSRELNGDNPIPEGFGFNPRDAHRKVGRDFLSGDYMLASKNASGDVSDAWHSYRLFNGDTFGNVANDIVHSLSFCQGSDAAQFDRMFYNQTNSADHFYLDMFFDVQSYAPMKSLYDVYDFKDDEHQKEVTIDNSQDN